MSWLLGSQQSTPMKPEPVEHLPGISGLGNQLLHRFMQILSGQLQQKPFTGFQSVFGGPGGSVPNRLQPAPTLNTGGVGTTGGGTNQSGGFQNMINMIVQQALSGREPGANR